MITDEDRLVALVSELISQGADPNDLLRAFESGVFATTLWALWGDGRWRKAMVCSKCGSFYPGICNDLNTEGGPWSGDKGYHKNQPGVTVIPFTEWEALHAS